MADQSKPQNEITFVHVVWTCIDNDDFMRQYDRLRGTNLCENLGHDSGGTSRSHLGQRAEVRRRIGEQMIIDTRKEWTVQEKLVLASHWVTAKPNRRMAVTAGGAIAVTVTFVWETERGPGACSSTTHRPLSAAFETAFEEAFDDLHALFQKEFELITKNDIWKPRRKW